MTYEIRNDSFVWMKKRFSFSEILIVVLIAIVSILIILTLGFWTRYLKDNRDIDKLKSVMQDVVDKRGEKALLEMAGIDVDDIYYSSEGLSLYTGDTSSKSFTPKEARSIAIYKKTKESVVQIQPLSELSDSGQGSGVVVSSDGYIVTNKHVIGSADRLNVNFYNGDSLEGKLIGYDALTDIALIKVDASGFEAIELGSSENLIEGQSLWAIGNPYGFTWSFTSGMVSGLKRMVFNSDGNLIPNMIQTDALINPGNSGGPLLDGNGRMIGLVSSIYSTSGSAQGISFALPVETVVDVVKQIIEFGTVHRGWLDILSVELNAQIVAYSSLPVENGILISQVVPAGKADKSGLKGGNTKAQYGQSVIYLGGDVIVRMDGREIKGYDDYFVALFSTKPGDKIDIVVNRKGQEVHIKDVVLIEQTEENTKWILR